MADKGYYKGVTIKFEGDDSALSAVLASIDKGMREVTGNANKLDAALRIKGDDLGTVTDKVAALEKQVRFATERAAALREALQTDEARGDQTLYDRLSAQLHEAEARLSDFRDRLVEARTEADRLAGEGLAGVSRQLEDMGDALETAGKATAGVGDALTTGVTAPIAAIAAATTAAAVEIDSALTDVRKTVDGTEQDYQRLHDAAIEFSKTNAVSAEQMLSAEALGAQLGYDIDQLESFGQVATGLDLSTNMDLETAATNLAQFANITDMAREDTERYGSTIVALGNTMATTESSVSDMAMRIAAAGSQVGMSQADILGLSAALSSMGINAEAGGTAISTIISQIDADVAKNTENVATWASAAGMSAQEFARQWQSSPVEALSAVITGLDEATQSEGNMTLMLDELGVSSIRQTDTMKRLASNSGLLTEAVATANAAWQDNTALSEEVANRNESLESKLQMLQNRVTAVLEQVGKPVADALLGIVDGAAPVLGAIEGVAQAFADLPDPVQEAVVTLGVAAAAAGPVLSVWGRMEEQAGKVAGVISDLAGGMAEYAEATAEGYGAIDALDIAFDGLGKTLAGLGKVAAAAAVVALVAELAGEVMEYVAAEREFEEANEGLREAVTHTGEALSGLTGPAADAVRSYEEVKAATHELNEAQAQLAESLTGALDDAARSSATLDLYVGTIEELADKGSLTAGEEERLAAAVKGFNDVTGASLEIVDAHTGKLSANVDAVTRAADAYREYAQVQALMNAYTGIQEQIIENEIEMERLQEERMRMYSDSEWTIHESETYDAIEDAYVKARERAEELQDASARVSERMDDASISADGYSKVLEDLGLAAKSAGDSASDAGDETAEAAEDAADAITDAAEEAKRAITDAAEAYKRELEDAYTARKRQLDDGQSALKDAHDREEQEAKDHWDEQKQILKDGLDEQADQVEKALKDEYDLRKEELGNQRDLLKESLAEELSMLSDSLDEAYDLRKSELDEEYSLLKDQLSKQVSAAKKAQSEETANLREAQKERRQAISDAMAEAVAARREALDQQVADHKAANAQVLADLVATHSAAEAALKKSNDALYKERQKESQREYKAWQKENSKRLKEYKAQQQAEVKEYKAATQERIAQLKAEYEARKRYLEDNDGTSELDARIASLNAEAKAEEEAERQREREERLADLRAAVQQAKTVRSRQDAEKELSDYLRQISDEDRKAERERLIESLEDQRDAIAEETKLRQSALDEQRDAEVASYQEARDVELEQLQARQEASYEALSEQLSAELELRKDRQDEQLAAYKETLDNELSALREQNQAAQDELSARHDAEIAAIEARNESEVSAMEKRNESVLAAMEKADEDAIAQMEAAGEARIEQMEAENAARLKEVKSANEAELKELKDRNDAEVEDRRSANEAILKDREKRDAEELEAIETANSEQMKKISDRNAAEVEDFADKAQAIISELKAQNDAAETALKRYDEDVLTELKRKNDDALQQFKRDLEDGKLVVDAKTGEVKRAVADASKSVTDDAKSAGEGAKSAADGASRYVTDEVLKAKESVLGNTGKMRSGVEKDNKDTKKSTEDTWRDIQTAASDGSDKVYRDTTGNIGKLPSWMETTGPQIPQGLANGMSNGMSPLSQRVMEVSQEIEKVDRSGDATAWGSDLLTNLINGIGSMWGQFTTTVGNVAQYIADNLGHSVPKEGVLHEGGRGEVVWGEDLMANIARGVENGTPAVADAMDQVSRAIYDAFETDPVVERVRTMHELVVRELKVTARDASAVAREGMLELETWATRATTASLADAYKAQMDEAMAGVAAMEERAARLRSLVGATAAQAAPINVSVSIERVSFSGSRSDIRRASQELGAETAREIRNRVGGW